MNGVWFVTGTDTGAGKTVLTALLARWLRESGRSVRAVKPFCSGGRDDVRILRRASGTGDSLDALNPWHYRAALAPLLAARAVGRPVSLPEVAGFVRHAAQGTEVLLVEGAGGLLSPLGEGFDARDVIRELDLAVVVVAPNRLGAINQVRLVVEALGRRGREARVALMAPPRRDRVSRTNLEMLREFLGERRVLEIPRFPRPDAPAPDARLASELDRWLGGPAGEIDRG